MTTNALQWCLLILGILVGGCQQESNVANQSDVAGTYALVTVDGAKVPATVSHEGVNLLVRSGTFTLNADGTCSSKMAFVPPSGTEATREVSGTYTRDGVKLTMQWKGAGTTVGSIEGNTFTMNNEGMTLAYRK